MSKQHIPTDTELLNFLQAGTRDGCLWMCRQSVAGGMTVHELLSQNAKHFPDDAYPTIREAIAAAMGVKIEPSGAGR